VRLSENEIRDITKALEAGIPLDDKYRFLLFDSNRELELVWDGKSQEITNVVLPFQTIEHVDEPRKEFGDDSQLALFDTSTGRQVKGWTNKLIWGDNKFVLSSIIKGRLAQAIGEQGGVKLIYIDPPFSVGADFSMDVTVGEEKFEKQANILEEIAYRDTWGKGNDSFLSMIYERIRLARDILNKDGLIFVHCDYRVDAYIRTIMDEIFGKSCFVNQIIWRRKGGAALKDMGSLSNSHDIILCYSKTCGTKINPVYADAPEDYIKTQFRYTDEDGRRFMVNVMRSPSPRPNLMYDYKGYKTPPNGWSVPRETMEKLESEDRLYFPDTKDKQIYKKIYLDEYPGQMINTLWTDIPVLKGKNKEILGYPTQKPEALLERILLMGSNEGDLVMDFFCGSGTTCAVAERLGRKWIGADLGKFAIHTTRKRMIQLQRNLKQQGSSYRAFEILNLGRYERQHFVNNLTSSTEGREKSQAFERLVLEAYKAEQVSGFRTIVGKRAGRPISIGPVNLPCSRLFVEKVVEECLEKNITSVDILAFEYEMGLFPEIQEVAKSQGVALNLKYIPKDVFDKRAVASGDVRFYDVAYVEVSSKIKDGEVSITLSNYSVAYGSDSIKEELRRLEKGERVISIEDGQVVSLRKNKKTGNVEHELITKTWTDWIDYWSVDFDFESNVSTEIQEESGMHDEIKQSKSFIFENEWQSFRSPEQKSLELSTPFVRPKKTRCKVAIKVIDIFGNDTMKVVDLEV
jgi:adenine-specific DNA-methyltransferase